MERLLVAWLPSLAEEGEHGREARALRGAVARLEALSPLVETVRPGLCAMGTRGPSRYLGGDRALAARAAATLAVVAGPDGTPLGSALGVGVADGLLAAVLAARAALALGSPVVVDPGDSAAFLARHPVEVLDRPELADLLRRLGITTLGSFAALPRRHVLARFGTDGDACHQAARGVVGDLPGRRPARSRGRFAALPPLPGTGTAGADGTGGAATGDSGPRPRQPGFWGGSAGAARRATSAVAAVQRLLGPEAVVRARLQGGRGPRERARFVPWGGRAPCSDGGPFVEGDVVEPAFSPSGDRGLGAPWPGQVPTPAPAVVLDRRLPLELTDGAGRPVRVTGRGTASATPARLALDGGPATAVAGWTGPWPAEERWWSPPGRRRRARMQVVTAGGSAYLVAVEQGRWWLEAVHD